MEEPKEKPKRGRPVKYTKEEARERHNEYNRRYMKERNKIIRELKHLMPSISLKK